jgi:hypothetical protein
MKNAQMAKQDDYRKKTQHNHYGPPHHHNRAYGRNDNNKRLNTTYDRQKNQDKRSRNDRGRSSSRDCSNSQMRSLRSPGDNSETSHHYMMRKGSTRKLSRSTRSMQHHRKVSNTVAKQHEKTKTLKENIK